MEEEQVARFVRTVLMDCIDGQAQLDDAVGALCLLVQFAHQDDQDGIDALVQAVKSRLVAMH